MLVTEYKVAENNEDTREKLAREVVDSWDMDDLVGFAVDRLLDDYQLNPCQFDEDWSTMFPEEVALLVPDVIDTLPPKEFAETPAVMFTEPP